MMINAGVNGRACMHNQALDIDTAEIELFIAHRQDEPMQVLGQF